ELLLRDFWRVSSVHDETRDAVTKRMKSAPWNVERVEDRPELILHDFVARWWPTVPSDEEKPLRIGFPFFLVSTQNSREHIGEGYRGRAFFALCGLHVSIPRGAANLNALVLKVDVRRL